MKIYPEKLSPSLAEQLRPVYLLTGDEPLQLLEAQDQIRKAARDAGTGERLRFEVEGQFDWNQVTESTGSLSLFAEQRLIELHFRNKPNAQAQAFFKEHAEALVESGDRLLITCPRIDKRAQNAKWFKALEALGVVVEVFAVAPERLPAWLARRGKALGLTFSNDALELLAERCEGNLLAAKQDLEKLALLVTSPATGPVDVATVSGLVADNARFTSFELVDTTLAGDAGKALKMLARLRQENLPVLPIAALVTRECRQLAQMAESVAAGQSIQAVVAASHAWPKKRPLLTAALGRLGVKGWQQLLRRLARIDLLIKGQGQGDPFSELATCLAIMAGARPFGSARRKAS